MLIQDQFGIIQNLQTSPIHRTSFLPWTFLLLLTAQPVMEFQTQGCKIRQNWGTDSKGAFDLIEIFEME